ncbi:AAA family ATPase [Crocosphaera watsonii]|uniref:Chromosome (Plasmid) partitioning protein ParA n=3 Tax=Crocosphaera watsonii TaxID=263511 RepID=G5JF02_CROWT|nr:AAA family ATPase [Crocosphaera watsonii]EHJ09233.1 Chromosome (plasmid) partitioning protein ParA [Crocosphaera watsonii WH 0003]
MIIAFLNLKGGCGKSTTAVHLCRYLLDKQRTVALVDSDGQGTSSMWINNLKESIPRPRVYRITEPDPLLDSIPVMAENFDDVVIDGAGGLAEMQRVILLVADLVFIPIQPSAPDLLASEEIINSVRRVRRVRNGSPLAYSFLNRTVSNTLLNREAKTALKNYQDVPLLKTEIPQRQIIADLMGQNSTLWDLKSKIARQMEKCYCQLFEEVSIG